MQAKIGTATAKAADVPDSKTGPHGAAGAAAAAADANVSADSAGGAESVEVELGGQGLVVAVFRGMFPDTFQEVVPVRNHKASRPSSNLCSCDLCAGLVIYAHTPKLGPML
jgi:hypothetical protein